MHVVRPSRQFPQKASADRHPSFALAFHEEARARHSELEARRQKQDRVLTQLLAGTSDARWTTVRSWRCLCLSSEGRFFHLQNEAGIGWLLDACGRGDTAALHGSSCLPHANDGSELLGSALRVAYLAYPASFLLCDIQAPRTLR